MDVIANATSCDQVDPQADDGSKQLDQNLMSTLAPLSVEAAVLPQNYSKSNVILLMISLSRLLVSYIVHSET